MFMLIIWLQGIWLPQHGYDFTDTPLWAGIYILPLTMGMLLAGPTSGYLSDRFGARPFATGGMIGAAISFVLLALLPTDFSYPLFAVVLFLNGVSMGLFASPNRAGVMNSLPPADRGAGGGMNQTFQNSAQVLSIGIFFTLMILGLASTLPHAMASGLQAHGVPAHTAQVAAHLPPVSILFAAFLGYNPIQHLLGSSVLTHLTHAQQSLLTGRSFFPQLISAPFRDGLHEAFAFAIVACLVAAAASWFRGGKAAPAAGQPPEPGRDVRGADARRAARRDDRRPLTGRSELLLEGQHEQHDGDGPGEDHDHQVRGQDHAQGASRIARPLGRSVAHGGRVRRWVGRRRRLVSAPAGDRLGQGVGDEPVEADLLALGGLGELLMQVARHPYQEPSAVPGGRLGGLAGPGRPRRAGLGLVRRRHSG